MICPNCKSEQRVTEQNFGALYTCGSCQAVYFLNFDGQPEFGEASSEDYAVANSELEGLVVAQSTTQPYTPEQAPEELGSLEPQIATTDLLEQANNFEAFVSPIANSLESQQESPFDMQNNMSAMNSDLTQQEIDRQFQAKKAVEPTPTLKAKPVQALSNSFADIAQEISDYANTDSQLSGLSYDIIISGIDTLETKNLFKEAIEDSKFAWDSFEILKSLKNGRVEIKKISPAKAFLLAKRIQFLDVEKQWKQNANS